MIGPTFYKIRLGKDRPVCGMKIWKGFGRDPITGEILERAYCWRCELDGVPTEINDIFEWWGDAGAPEEPPGAEIISETDYKFYCEDHSWAAKYKPHDPAANPRKKVDLNKIDPIRW